jgi:hypothetical protein
LPEVHTCLRLRVKKPEFLCAVNYGFARAGIPQECKEGARAVLEPRDEWNNFETWFHYLSCPFSYDFSLLHSNGGSFYGAASRKAKFERRARADPAVCEKF